jgi:hypothetical protein
MSQAHHDHHHANPHTKEIARGGFWLAALALVLVLAAAPGRVAGLWSLSAQGFLMHWGTYQGAFSGCFGVGVILADLRKPVVRWALPSVLLGLVAVAIGGLTLFGR